MTSRTLLAIAIVALTATAALAGHPLASRGLQAVTVGVDVDPGAAPANGATSLGSIEGCTRVENSAGNQFFIVLTDQPSLKGQYTIYGEVTAGLEVADKIGETPVEGDKAKERIVIRKVTLREIASQQQE